MSSFFESGEQPASAGKLSTHRNPAMKTLTLVAQGLTCDTPPAGIPALPRTALKRANPVEKRNTDPLPPIPMSMAIPPSMPERSGQTLSRTLLPAHPVPSDSAWAASHKARVMESAREMAQQGVNAIFKAVLWATDPKVINQIERRDRVVFLLLDGKRTIRDISRLVRRDELDVARTIVRLLKQGYAVHMSLLP